MKKATAIVFLVCMVLMCNIFGYAENTAVSDLFVGDYCDVNNVETKLHIVREEERYKVMVDIFRLVGFEFYAHIDTDVLCGTAIINDESNAIIVIQRDEDIIRLVIKSSDWPLLPAENIYEFVEDEEAKSADPK